MVNRKINLEKILFILMISCMVIYNIFIYFNQPWEIYNNSIRQIRNNDVLLIGILLIGFVMLLGLLCFSLPKQKYPKHVLIPTLLLLIFGFFWYAYAVFVNRISFTVVLRDTFPPISLIACGLILVGYNDDFWPLIKKIIYYISVVFVLLSFVEIIKAYSNFGFEYRITSGAPMYLYEIGLFATYGLITLTDEWKEKRKALLFVLVILLVFNSAVLQGRSWFAQTIVLFVIYIYRIRGVFKKGSAIRLVLPILILGIAITIFVSNSDLFMALIDRFNSSGDTRTPQLQTFFAQVDFIDLMFGQGTTASYYFMGNPKYTYIDNQVLLFLFRFGVIPTVSYLFILIYPIIKAFSSKNKELILKCLPLVSWFAAMLGLSVYFNISFGVASTLMVLYIGRLMYELNLKTRN